MPIVSVGAIHVVKNLQELRQSLQGVRVEKVEPVEKVLPDTITIHSQVMNPAPKSEKSDYLADLLTSQE